MTSLDEMTRAAFVGMKPPRLTESGFMRQVVELATMFGWHTAHFRPAQTSKGWRTPVQGDLGAGFPDLVMARTSDSRLIFAELKRDGAKPTEDQERVLTILSAVAGGIHRVSDAPMQRVEVFVWRPADFDRIAELLR